jgi:D-alanyl-D-alanine carboxypeptidase
MSPRTSHPGLRTSRHKAQTLLLGIASLLLAGCGSSSMPTPQIPASPTEMLRQQIGTPAVAVAVMSSQATLESGVSGLRIVNGTAQVTPADLWHLGSNTKAMTAALAGVLVQRGQIKWDTTLADVLPNQPGVLPVYEAITLEELLSHRAGVIPLTEFNSLPEFTGDFHQRRLEFVSWALSQPPVAPPGTEMVYSNAGYVVVAAMLETVMNEPWEQALTNEVLTPLGLHGKFNWPGAADPNQPWGHTWPNGQWVPNDPNSPYNEFPPVLNPAGNLSINVGDDAKWALMNLRGLEGTDSAILTATTIKKLHTAVGVPAGQPGYALGWGIASVDGHLVSYHLGSAGTFDAEIAIDPTRDRALVILANGDNSGATFTPTSTLQTMDTITLYLLAQ